MTNEFGNSEEGVTQAPELRVRRTVICGGKRGKGVASIGPVART